MELDLSHMLSTAFDRKGIFVPGQERIASTEANGAVSPLSTQQFAGAYTGEALTVSKREFPIPGESTETVDGDLLPEDTFNRKDLLGQYVGRAFDYPPPPRPAFE